MALYIEIKAADGAVSRTRLEPGRNRLSVRVGDTYRVYDDQTGQAPDGASVKRLDNILIVDGLPAAGAGGERPTVELADFYTVCSVGSPCQLVLDGGSGGSTTVITPGTAPIGALADGSFVLHDPGYKPVETAPVSSYDSNNVGRYALYGLGGLAVVGLAAGGGGGGGKKGDTPPEGTPSDGTLKFTGATAFNSRLPTLRGDGEPGARITVRIDTDGDGVANATYGTTVGNDGRWTLDLTSVQPESGSLPNGLSDVNNVQIAQTGSGGVTNLPTFSYRYDGTPPAPAVIDRVATDDVVNATEKGQGVTIGGTAEAGATVSVTWGSAVLAAVVDAGGRWSVTVPATSVPADGATTVSVIVTDPAGNVSPAATHAVTVTTAAATLNIVQAAGDAPTNAKVNAAEAAVGVTIVGTAEANSTVNVTWLGVSHGATADGNGNWSVSYAPGEIAPANGAVTPYQVTVTNPVGNTNTAGGNITVDTVAPTAPVISAVSAGPEVNQSEKATGVVISGTGGEPGIGVTVAWGSSTATSASVADAAGNWSVTFTSASIPVDGSYNLIATVTDDAGNPSPPSAPVPISVNTTPPALTVAPVATDNIVTVAEASTGVAISGTTSAGSSVTVDWLGVSHAAVVTGTTWTATFSSVELAGVNGEARSYTVHSTNAAGNSATATGSVTIDTVPPAGVTNVSVTEDSPGFFGLAGNVSEANVSVAVSIDGGISYTAAAVSALSWHAPNLIAIVEPTPALVRVRVTDLVGNETTTTPTVAIAAQDGDAPLALQFDDVLMGTDDFSPAASPIAHHSPADTLATLLPVEDFNRTA